MEPERALFSYLDRCQTLLQRGLPVADALYYYGDNIPNFTQLRASDPARVGAGYDYDVVDENALLTRVSVKNGELVLPEGIRYHALVLPDRTAISLPVLRKIREFVAAGATVVGNTRPIAATGLTDYANRDAEVAKLAGELWNDATPSRVVAGKKTRDVLLGSGVRPDFECAGDAQADVSYIHRRDGATEIYFVASRGEHP